MGTDEIDTLLNKRSGARCWACAGDNDMREIGRRMAEGDKAAQLAFDVYVHRLRRYVGALQRGARPGRRDHLHGGRRREFGRRSRGGRCRIFTIWVSPWTRCAMPCAACRTPGVGRLVRVAVAVVPTDEELEIARDTFALAGKTPAHHSG